MGVDRVKIVHLYPDELNLYDDVGNVLCIYNRLLWRGYKVDVHRVGIGDKIPDFDILIIGGGQDREMQIISSDLKRKSDIISYSVNSGKVVFAVCGGYQLLGDYYKSQNGSVIDFTSSLPFYTVAGKQRMIGNVVFKTPFGNVVGFENHSGKTYLSKHLTPLGTVLCGFGNNGSDKSEGILFKSTFGTYAHGAVLPKNPFLADEIIKRALNTDEIAQLNDEIEIKCNKYLINRFL